MKTLAATRLQHAEDVAMAWLEQCRTQRRRAEEAYADRKAGKISSSELDRAFQRYREAVEQLEAAERAVNAAVDALIAEGRGR